MGKSEKKSKEKKQHKDKSRRKDDRKKSKHRSKQSRSNSKDAYDPVDSLSIMLTHGLLMFPDLQEDIPAMLIAMDGGECINIAAISNPERREFLEMLFDHPNMPAEFHAGSGWAKAGGCACIRRTVLNTFVSNGDVINPQELNQSQARAARIAPVVQALLKKIPDLIAELGTLFTMLCDGEAVDLGGMDNKEVKKALSQCLRDIGIDQPEDGGKYSFCLPEFEEDIMREALQHHAKVLSALAEFKGKAAKRKANSATEKDEAKENEHENESEGDRSGASSDSERSASEDEGSDTSSAGPQPVGPGLKGPARPTMEQIKEAQAAAAMMIEHDSDSEASQGGIDEDAGVGPLLPTAGMPSGNATAASVPALYDALGAEGFDVPKPASSDAPAEPTDNTSGREEWMLTPGQNRPSGGIDQLFKSGKNRFEGGKEAKKAAAALKAEREAVEKLMEDPEEKKRTDAILAEYREKRGPSLMDAHLEKVGKKPKLANTRMKSFDHEKEMGGNRKMNIKDVQGMVQQSKELDTRFDKASVQKNFL